MLLWSMWRLMRRSRPDVLLTWTLKPNLYGPLAGRLAGVNRIGIVVCGLGRLLLRRGFLSRLGWWMLRASARRTDCVFVQNQDDLLSLQDHGVVGATGGPVLTAGCGVDLDAFPVAPLPDQPVVLMLARLLASKGVHEYLEAAAIVRRQRPEVRFRLAGLFETGNDAISESVIEAAVERGDVEYLGFLESQDMVQDAIRRSSLYVLPSWHEGTPHSTLEAMSMGRAVVTTDVRGCRETVIDGMNGRLVPVKDPKALAIAIIEVLGSPEQLATMGRQSRKRAAGTFDADRVAELIMSRVSL
jgi:glycosyltransferase involved in cell wall biosynthesis